MSELICNGSMSASASKRCELDGKIAAYRS